MATPQEAIQRLEDKFTKTLNRSRYMETNCVPTTYPGWNGFPLSECSYSVKDKNGTSKSAKVIMLNPSMKQLARWIVDACLAVKGKIQFTDTDKLFKQVLNASG